MGSSGFNSICWGDSTFKKYMSMHAIIIEYPVGVYAFIAIYRKNIHNRNV